MAFGDDFLNRFGPYRLQPYNVSVYGGLPIGGPAGAQMGGTVAPPPAGTGGSTPPPNVPPGTGSGSGTGVGGNAGGASHGVGGGGAGDNAGHPGASGGFDNASAAVGAAGLDGGLFGNMGPASYIDAGPYISNALQVASSLAPFPYSLIPTLASTAMRGWNTANTDAIRSSLGVPGLDVGQVIGSLLGLNDYGTTSGNNLVASKEQYKDAYGSSVGISTGGLHTDNFGPFGILGSGALQTTYTPEEARLRQIANASSPPAAPRPPYSVNPDGSLAGSQVLTTGTPAPKPQPNNAKMPSNAYVGENGAVLVNNHGVEMQIGAMINGSYVAGGGTSGGYGAGSGGSANAGQSYGNTSNASGYGNANNSQIGGATGHDTTAVGASGQLGHIATGGYIPGDPRIGDNKLMFTTPGEFVVNRDSARRAAGLLGLVNADPRAAERLDAMVRGWPRLGGGRHGVPRSFATPLRGFSG